MFKPFITILTPTTGDSRLVRLVESINQQVNVQWVHILLWDGKREGDFSVDREQPKSPFCFDQNLADGVRYSIVVPGKMVQGSAAGSALRAIGLMAARTPYVTFADTDVMYERNHLKLMVDSLVSSGCSWGYCKRKIWANETECLGVDNFESVGDSPSRKVPYEMVDNNTMIFDRRLGTSGAVLYRETAEYNDDRLFYSFLKENGGPPVKIEEATVNQICPKRLESMFRENCTNAL